MVVVVAVVVVGVVVVVVGECPLYLATAGTAVRPTDRRSRMRAEQWFGWAEVVAVL